jgi:hypothetical protein
LFFELDVELGEDLFAHERISQSSGSRSDTGSGFTGSTCFRDPSVIRENRPFVAFYLERARKHLLENRGQSGKAEFVGFNGA